MTCSPCNEQALHWRVIDLRGMRYGRLLVKTHAGQQGANRNHHWNCLCDCGLEVTVDGAALRSGNTKSCGCLQREKARAAGDRTRTHGKTRTTTHNVWSGMVQRCRDPNRKDYYRYGGAGITVCERWQKFENFLADMGERPAGMSLDRIDNSKGYEPSNCRWATAREQVQNSSAVRMVTINGKTQCIADWCTEVGIAKGTVSARMHAGWSPEKAILTPINPAFRNTGARR